MHLVRLEPTKLIFVGTRTTYQATGNAMEKPLMFFSPSFFLWSHSFRSRKKIYTWYIRMLRTLGALKKEVHVFCTQHSYNPSLGPQRNISVGKHRKNKSSACAYVRLYLLCTLKSLYLRCTGSTVYRWASFIEGGILLVRESTSTIN